MKYKIVTSGKTKIVTLGEISRNLKVQSDVFIVSDREIYLGIISHKTFVFFLVEFAHYAVQNYTKKKLPEAEICICLTRKWLEDQESVSNEQLIAAAYAADGMAYAAYAAYAAADADDAYPNYADDNYDGAANAAADAADAAGVDKDKEFLRQGEFIIDFLKSGNNFFLV